MQVKIGSGKVAEPDFQRNGLPPELPNVQMRDCCKIKFWKIRPKKKLARIAKTVVLANFFHAQIFRLGLKITFCNRPLRGKSSENFSATLPESSARRQHWGQGFPLQARFDIKTLCLRETPALKGRRFTAARGGRSCLRRSASNKKFHSQG